MQSAKIKSVKFNFLMNAILTASSFVFPFITFPYISRVLLPEGVGKVNFATSVVSYFCMFAMLGIPTYGIRTCAQVRDDREELSRVVHEILFINFLMSIAVYGIYFWTLYNVPRLKSDFLLFCVTGATVFINIIGVEWLYKGLEQYSYITIRSIVFKIIAVCLMFLYVKDRTDYVVYGAISVFAAVGSNILNFINLRKYIDLRPVGNYHFQRHMRAILFFFLMSVATTIYTNLDVVMLGFMKDDTAVGYYSTAVKIKNILVSFVTALSTVLLPRVSYYIEHGMREQFIQTGQKALNFVILAAFPVTVYFTMFADESILLLSGDAFQGSVVPMIIIMPTVLFIGVTNILGIQILVPLGKEKLVFYSVLAGAVVDLLINAACIPGMAASGAALGTVIAEGVVLVVQVLMLKDLFGQISKSLQVVKIFLAVAGGAAGSLWLKWTDMPCFIRLSVSAIIFFGIYGCILLAAKEPFVCEVTKQLYSVRRKKRGGNGNR